MKKNLSQKPDLGLATAVAKNLRGSIWLAAGLLLLVWTSPHIQAQTPKPQLSAPVEPLKPVIRSAPPAPKKAKAEKEKDEGNFSYEIQSTTKGLSLVKDGIMGGGVGLVFPGRKGLNEITVTAPNHGSRRLRFWLKPDIKKTVVIEMAETKHDKVLDWKSPFKRFDAQKLDQKASLCIWYMTKVQEKLYCDRISLLDDIFYTDDSIFKQDDLRDFQVSGELAEFRRLVTRVTQIDATSEIEDFLTRHPNQSSVYHLASLHSLLRGDCPRVHSLFTEAVQYVTRLSPLRFHMAVCADAHKNEKLRDEILAQGMKEKSGIQSLAYWAFQSQVQTLLPKASDAALSCLKSRPGDKRCQDAMAMLARLQGKPARPTPSEIEDVTFKTFLEIEDKLPKGQQEALYFLVAAQLENYPHSIENYLFMSWINAVFSKDLAKDDYISHRIQVAAVLGGSTLDKIVEAVEKAELTQLLPPIYQRRLRFAPEDPNLWYRLIRSYAKAKQCPEMLAAIEKGNAYLPKYNASLLQMRGSCEVEMNRLNEALTTYLKIMEVNPKLWSSPFNLANVYERLEKRSEAAVFFKKTLGLNPPPEVAETIKTRLKATDTSSSN